MKLVSKNAEGQIPDKVLLLLAEDDPGHANLVMKNLKRTGITNEIKHFRDGQVWNLPLQSHKIQVGTYMAPSKGLQLLLFWGVGDIAYIIDEKKFVF